MRDVELYRQLLGIEAPWKVETVEMSVPEQQVAVVVTHARGVRFACPECGDLLSVYDHSEERAWRHLDSCGFATWLRARPPRVHCPEHGVRQVVMPWAEPHSRFTILFERLAIDVLGETDVSGACKILRISWDEAWHLMERAVARGQARKARRLPELLGVDEKAIAKARKYLTLVCDLERSTIEHIAEDRKAHSLGAYFENFSEEELSQVKAVAIDMWEPYIAAVKSHLPDGEDKIVFDRFHIMNHMGSAVDLVRRQEHQLLRRQGNTMLGGSRYLWLYAEENLPQVDKERFVALKVTNLRTARAWAIKESLRVLWDYRHPAWARRFWKQWYFWATHSRMRPVIEVARMLARHITGILNYFSAARITNGTAEGLNSKIGTIKKMANGFRNKEHFKTAIYFRCGGLDLYPQALPTHAKAG
jgi:transposase